MWADHSVFYQIYPLGFCGAPVQNDEITVPRIGKVTEWVEHILNLGCNAVYFGPVFESDAHGYDTRDYQKIDRRLGTNKDFADVCQTMHHAGIKIVLDGVFNHVGRGFWAFQDVLQNRESSPYRDWFYINFEGNDNYNDRLWYEGWEGHYELVKLNLKNPAVVDHLLTCVGHWIDEFQIDGLRLDVAYLLDRDFLKKLRAFTTSRKAEFFLLGEIIGGDYRQIMNHEMCDSVTNYECYKGLYSSFNSLNLFEIVHSLLRQFGPDPWALFPGAHPLSFVDNHDVTRAASILTNKKHIPILYALLFGMPGIPCIYYGSEWGAEGRKENGDAALRPCFTAPQKNQLTDWIASCAKARRSSAALCDGSFRSLVLQNQYCIFERKTANDRVLVAVNIGDTAVHVDFDAGAGRARDLITGQVHDFGGGTNLPPYFAAFWQIF